jgi:selenocysteine lyase/cysteine desulfurase
VDFIAGLGSGSSGDRRSRVLASMRAVADHEDGLFGRLLDGLGGLPGVTVHGAPKRRTPTAFFSVAGRSGAEVYEHLAGLEVNAPASAFYAIEASRWIGLGDTGAVRAGIAPYTDDEDLDRLLTGIAELAR